MDDAQRQSIIIAVLPTKSAAERARKALHDAGHSIAQAQIYFRGRRGNGDIRDAEELRAFPDDLMRQLEEALEKRHALLSVVSESDPDALIAVIAQFEPIGLEVGEMPAAGTSHQSMALREERLKVEKTKREIGEIVVRKVVEEIPAQAEVEAIHEELDVEHVSVGEVVEQRREPWREGDVLVVPVYEEQLVVVRQLVMREQLRISLHKVSEQHVLAETVKREHAVIEDPQNTGRVRVRRRGGETPPAEESSAPDQPGH